MVPVIYSFILIFYLSPISKTRVIGEPIVYKSCGPTGSISSVDLSPCSSQPCSFKHGINVTIKLNFTSGVNSESLKSDVYGIIGGIPIRFPLPKPDACTGCHVTCPIQAGSAYAYINTLPVLKSYPTIKLVVKWQLVGDTDQIVSCFLFPIEIYDADSGKYSLPTGIYDADSGIYSLPTGISDADSGKYSLPTGISDANSGKYSLSTGIYDADSGKYSLPTGISDADSGKYSLPTGISDADSGKYTLPTEIADDGSN